MTVVDVTRRLVLRTSSWPGLRELYHEGYELGLAFTVGRLKSVPGVLAVMLRARDAGRRWVPGLSDYDLTVLTERHERPRTIRFLDHLWGRYRSIKRVIPQLGEMEVMTVDEYDDFLSFGPMPTASLKHAYPLFVKANSPDVDHVLQRPPRPRRDTEFLLDALSRYIRFAFPAWLQFSAARTNATRRRVEHLLDNVTERLNRLRTPADAPAVGTLAAGMFRVFEDLSRVCGRIQLSDGQAGSVEGTDSTRASECSTRMLGPACIDAVQHCGIRDCSVVIWNSYLTADSPNLVFVVPDEAPRDELLRLLTSLGTVQRTAEDLLTKDSRHHECRLFFPSLAGPVVMSRSMWRCWRELSPFDGVAVATTGRTMIGPDERHAMPSRVALRRGAEVQYAALLPLKNNWRPLRGPGSPQLYSAMVNHVRGYTSALSGEVLTQPTAREFASVQEGLSAVTEELHVLRTKLMS